MLHFNGRVSERERATRGFMAHGDEALSERTRTENAGKRSGGRTRRHARRGRRPGFHMFARKPHGHFAAATTRDCPRRTGGPRTRGSARASMPRNVSPWPLPDRRLKSPRMKREAARPSKRWNLQMVCRGKRSRAGKRPAASTIFTCQASTSGRVRPRNGACGRPSGRVQTARLGTRWKTVGPLPPPGFIFIHPERPRGPCMRGCGRCFRVRPEPPVGTPDRARAARQVLRDAKSAR